jgi:regulator of replication initiation timing
MENHRVGGLILYPKFLLGGRKMKLFRSKKDVDLVSENRFLRLENMMLKQQLKLLQEDNDVLRLKLLEYQLNKELKGGEK